MVGLGNPGSQYAETRHNAGVWFIDAIAERYGGPWQQEKKFHGRLSKFHYEDFEGRLLVPSTFMNHSGQAVKAVSRYFHLKPKEILVIHDDLDLPPGTIRFKSGGGHGGHNGLRDIEHHLGTRDFLRLRLGIGHPGRQGDVTNFVLHPPSLHDRSRIESAIDEGFSVLDLLLSGQWQMVMNQLHQSPKQEKE